MVDDPPTTVDERSDLPNRTRRDLLLASAAAMLAGGIAPTGGPSTALAQGETTVPPRFADVVKQLATDSGVPTDGVVKVLLELGIGDAEAAIKCAGDTGKVDIRKKVTLEQARFSLRAAVMVVTM
ncbi:MAG TPA: hypothetical protein VH482_08375 [Thermomicrobiales bacterium]|jgi:hypothetical protein